MRTTRRLEKDDISMAGSDLPCAVDRKRENKMDQSTDLRNIECIRCKEASTIKRRQTRPTA